MLMFRLQKKKTYSSVSQLRGERQTYYQIPEKQNNQIPQRTATAWEEAHTLLLQENNVIIRPYEKPTHRNGVLATSLLEGIKFRKTLFPH